MGSFETIEVKLALGVAAFEDGLEEAQEILSDVDLADVPVVESDEDAAIAFYDALEVEE